MQLDYIDNINEYGEDIVRLYDFSKEEAILFRDAIKLIVIANKKELHLASLEFIEPRNCYLTLRLADIDEGIVTDDQVNFYCYLTFDGYEELLSRVEPFCLKETKAYRMLYEDIDNPTDFLFAPAGIWDDE
jgi:hypothetical protein